MIPSDPIRDFNDTAPPRPVQHVYSVGDNADVRALSFWSFQATLLVPSFSVVRQPAAASRDRDSPPPLCLGLFLGLCPGAVLFSWSGRFLTTSGLRAFKTERIILPCFSLGVVYLVRLFSQVIYRTTLSSSQLFLTLPPHGLTHAVPEPKRSRSIFPLSPNSFLNLVNACGSLPNLPARVCR